MKSDEILGLFEQIEALACEYEGMKCWSAWELSQLLGMHPIYEEIP